MNNYKNNPRRNRFKPNGDRNFRKRNGNGHHKSRLDFTNNSDFRRKNPGRNNQNAAKLIDKYNDMAREASSNGDKILSENYLQHAEHFSRIHSSQEMEKNIIINSQKTDNDAEKDTSKNDEISEDNNSSQLNIND